MAAHKLLRIALASCPREFRLKYGDSIISDMHKRGVSVFAVSADLIYQGVSMRVELLSGGFRAVYTNLRKAPSYVATIVIALALATASNVAAGSIVSYVLLQPLPYAHAGQLVHLSFDRNASQFSYLDARDVERMLRTMHALGMRAKDEGLFTNNSKDKSLSGSLVDGGYFRLLGARAEAGRLLQPSDIGTFNIVVSDDFWRRYLNTERSAVGSKVRLNGRAYSIVGIAQPGFLDITPRGLVRGDYWRPVNPRGLVEQQRGYTNFDLWGSLEPHTDIVVAAEDASRVVRDLIRRYPASHQAGADSSLTPALELIVQPVRRLVLLIYVATLVLVVVACAIAANLTLARALTVETAARYFAELRLLVLAGVILGLSMAERMLRCLDPIASPIIPRWDEVHIDAASIAFTLAILGICTLVLGVTIRLQKLHLGRLRTVFAIADIALTLSLITCAGLTIRSLAMLSQVNVGFDTAHLYAIELPPPLRAGRASQDVSPGRYLAMVRAIPGIAGATLASNAPFKNGFTVDTVIERHSGSRAVDGDAVDSNYLSVMRMPLLRGRTFDRRDRAGGQPVALVNASFALKYFGSLNVVGRWIAPSLISASSRSPVRMIVGVTGDTRDHFSGTMKPEFFLDQAQFGDPEIIIARDTGGVSGALIERALAALPSNHLAPHVLSYDLLLQQDAGRLRSAAALFGILALMALAISLPGFLDLSSGAAGAGVFLGLVLAASCTRFFEPLLFRTSPWDPLTLVSAAALVVGCAFVASTLPIVKRLFIVAG